MRSAPRDPLLVDAVFGLHRAADTAGAVAGPLPGLALYAALGHRLRSEALDNGFADAYSEEFLGDGRRVVRPRLRGSP